MLTRACSMRLCSTLIRMNAFHLHHPPTRRFSLRDCCIRERLCRPTNIRSAKSNQFYDPANEATYKVCNMQHHAAVCSHETSMHDRLGSMSCYCCPRSSGGRPPRRGPMPQIPDSSSGCLTCSAEVRACRLLKEQTRKGCQSSRRSWSSSRSGKVNGILSRS